MTVGSVAGGGAGHQQSSLVVTEWRDELHRFLWTAPFFNKKAKRRDEGWNCRDHALIMWGVLRALGIPAGIVTGCVALVEGREKFVLDVRPHCWLEVEGKAWDWSLRFPETPTLSWPLQGVFDSVVHPDGTAQVIVCAAEYAYEQVLNAATHLNDGRLVVYYRDEYRTPSRQSFERYWQLDSDISATVRRWFPKDKLRYLRLLTHLLLLLQGSAHALAGLTQKDAWRALASIPDDLVENEMVIIFDESLEPQR